MSFRLRLTMLAAGAVAVAIVAASFAVYFTDRAQLISQVDANLATTRALGVPGPLWLRAPSKLGPPLSPRLAFTVTEPQQLRPGSRLVVLRNSLAVVRLTVLPGKAVSAAAKPPRYSDVVIKNVDYRVLTYVAAGRVVQISGSLVEVERNLSHLRWLLVFISLGGVGAATLLGALVSGRAVAPLRRLAETAERIVDTGDLSQRTGQRGRDEVSRLSARLDELLASLEASQRTQRQLVADASHELRTPIATLRANMELLAAPGSLDEGERAEAAADARGELEAMTTLVGELVELARGEEVDVAPCEFRLDQLVGSVVERAARRSPEVRFRTRLEPTLVSGVPERVERAIWNLLDNARKWSPASATVDVRVERGLVEVRDRGPGIDVGDRPLIFNRFYRSAAARGMPGAGLGLAIVKQIADAHGGSVAASDAPGGGALMQLRLPARP